MEHPLPPTPPPAAARSDPAIDQTLRQAQAGDADAWRLLVERYSGRVFGLLYKQCGNRDLAEELTQATFVKIVTVMTNNSGSGGTTGSTPGGDTEGTPEGEAPGDSKDKTGGDTGGGAYQERGRFEPWLFRIAMNKLRDEMRRRKRQAMTMDMGPQSSTEDSPGGGWASLQPHVVSGGPAPAPDPLEQVSRDEQIQQLRQAIATMSQADQEVLHFRHTAQLTFAQIAQALDQPLGTVLARGHRALEKLKKLMVGGEGAEKNF
jgi:RNA polymerase sigma-70 factor (ECF subfamily)